MTSARFEELERRCAKLKKKRFVRISALSIVAFVCLVGGYIWMNPVDFQALLLDARQQMQTPVVAQNAVQQPSAPVEPAPIETKPIIEEKQPSTPVIESSVLKEVQPPNAEQEMKEEELFLAPFIALKKEELDKAKRAATMEEKLLASLQKSSSYDTALALAQFYVDNDVFADAILYAKKASLYDKTSAKPWLVYAKAKEALGQKEEAIRSLELFLSYSNSEEVATLLTLYKGQK